MSLADATPTFTPAARPLAVLAGVRPSVGDSVRSALQAAGHRVERVSGIGEIAAVGEDDQIAVVVIDGEEPAVADLGDAAWASLTPSGAELFAVHPEDDEVSALWRSFRSGVVPWLLDPVASLPGIAPVGPFGGELALAALHEELLGHHVEACRLLASIRHPDMVAEVVDILVRVGAAALDRLRDRSRFPVPTELLVQHLPAHVGTLRGEDVSRWWTMVEAAAFRSSGLLLPVRDRGLADQRFAVAFAAFHSASTIVGFTARRQWRRPAELLGDLADLG